MSRPSSRIAFALILIASVADSLTALRAGFISGVIVLSAGVAEK